MSRFRLLLLFVAALLLTRPLLAEKIRVAEPKSVGMSAEKLALVRPAMQKFVDDKRVAGATTVVLRKGKIVLFESVGKQSIDGDTPMNADTIVRLYSMSKPVTSVAIMMLVEEGKLGLDDPVAKHLPALKDVQVFDGMKDGEMQLAKVERAMTIRDLLRHTSGLTYGFFGSTAVDKQYRAANVLDRNSTLETLVSRLGKIPLLNQPGARFNYSVSVDVLGRVVEVVSGKRFDKFLQQRIFKPLGMKDTAFFVPDKKIERFASTHGPRLLVGGLRVSDAAASSEFRKPPTQPSGGGGLVGTAGDYIRFCQMLLNKGELDGVRLLKSESVEAMTKNQLPPAAYPIDLNGKRDGVGFGLGFSVVTEKTEYTKLSHVGEYGWGGAASTHFWISPKDDLAVVVLTQLMPFTFQMETAVKPLVYDAIVD